jgi:hypothetical protein
MKRLINLYSLKNKKDINGFINVEINNLENIINYSVDHIFCGCLNYIEADLIDKIIFSIIEKVRPKGYFTLSFVDMKKICRAYHNNAVSDSDLLKTIKDHKSILSYDKIKDLASGIEQINIVQTDFSDNYISIVIQREGV